MKLKITLKRAGRPVDLSVTADATATVGDVARALHDSDPSVAVPAPGSFTMRAIEELGTMRTQRKLDDASLIGESGIRSGSSVELVHLGTQFDDAERGRAAAVAVLKVLAGPDAGAEFPLPDGVTIIGRDRGVDVRLSDPLVSKRHARIHAGDAIEITDLNSANGVLIGGVAVARSVMVSGEQITLGDTVISVSTVLTGA
ncbi:FHA domain-containing protein, partial [Pseudoclavibacter helvolus]|uniref:FHA domain-containing protein n=1 Tax=Pseudoclavibacter helvolus TaxID=255205 RepID=UPI0024AE4C31